MCLIKYRIKLSNLIYSVVCPHQKRGRPGLSKERIPSIWARPIYGCPFQESKFKKKSGFPDLALHLGCYGWREALRNFTILSKNWLTPQNHFHAHDYHAFHVFFKIPDGFYPPWEHWKNAFYCKMESIERIDQTVVFMLPFYRFNLWIREVLK